MTPILYICILFTENTVDSFHYLTAFQASFFVFCTLQSVKSRLVFWIPQCAELKNKTCFQDFTACRVQNRSLFSDFARCEMQKQNLFSDSAHCRAQKQSLFLDSARCGVIIQNLFSVLCTLRNAKSEFVFASYSAMNHSYLDDFTILLSVRWVKHQPFISLSLYRKPYTDPFCESLDARSRSHYI